MKEKKMFGISLQDTRNIIKINCKSLDYIADIYALKASLERIYATLVLIFEIT